MPLYCMYGMPSHRMHAKTRSQYAGALKCAVTAVTDAAHAVGSGLALQGWMYPSLLTGESV